MPGRKSNSGATRFVPGDRRAGCQSWQSLTGAAGRACYNSGMRHIVLALLLSKNVFAADATPPSDAPPPANEAATKAADTETAPAKVPAKPSVRSALKGSLAKMKSALHGLAPDSERRKELHEAFKLFQDEVSHHPLLTVKEGSKRDVASLRGGAKKRFQERLARLKKALAALEAEAAQGARDASGLNLVKQVREQADAINKEISARQQEYDKLVDEGEGS